MPLKADLSVGPTGLVLRRLEQVGTRRRLHQLHGLISLRSVLAKLALEVDDLDLLTGGH